MDDSQKPYYTDGRSPSDGADLNVILYKVGRSIKQFFVGIGWMLANLGKAIVFILLYLFKNSIWLLAGAALGLGYGVYQLSTNGPKYNSEMTVKTNFNSARVLYNTVDYLNSLIGNSRQDELAKFFDIPADEVKNLRSFSVSPVKSELVAADLYNELFMKNDRSVKVRHDTFWLRTIKYEEFKNSLTDFDYPLHVVTASSRTPALFAHLENGILRNVASSRLLQDMQQQQAIINRDEEKVILASISNLDSLRKAYNERLVMRGQGANQPGSNQMMVVEGNPDLKAPELELYDKILELQDELRRVRKRSVTEREIVEVYSPFNLAGKKQSFWEIVDEYVITGLIAMAIILVSLLAYKNILAFEAQEQKKRTLEKQTGSI